MYINTVYIGTYSIVKVIFYKGFNQTSKSIDKLE